MIFQTRSDGQKKLIIHEKNIRIFIYRWKNK